MDETPADSAVRELDSLAGINSELPAFENALERALFLVAGEDPDVFSARKEVNASSVCRRIFKGDEIIYSCEDCQTDDTCCICEQCFHGGNHEGHSYKMSRADEDGVCDCGDETAWKSTGFCSTHSARDSAADPFAVLPATWSHERGGAVVAWVLKHLATDMWSEETLAEVANLPRDVFEDDYSDYDDEEEGEEEELEDVEGLDDAEDPGDEEANGNHDDDQQGGVGGGGHVCDCGHHHHHHHDGEDGEEEILDMDEDDGGMSYGAAVGGNILGVLNEDGEEMYSEEGEEVAPRPEPPKLDSPAGKRATAAVAWLAKVADWGDAMRRLIGEEMAKADRSRDEAVAQTVLGRMVESELHLYTTSLLQNTFNVYLRLLADTPFKTVLARELVTHYPQLLDAMVREGRNVDLSILDASVQVLTVPVVAVELVREGVLDTFGAALRDTLTLASAASLGHRIDCQHEIMQRELYYCPTTDLHYIIFAANTTPPRQFLKSFMVYGLGRVEGCALVWHQRQEDGHVDYEDRRWHVGGGLNEACDRVVDDIVKLLRADPERAQETLDDAFATMSCYAAVDSVMDCDFARPSGVAVPRLKISAFMPLRRLAVLLLCAGIQNGSIVPPAIPSAEHSRTPLDVAMDEVRAKYEPGAEAAFDDVMNAFLQEGRAPGGVPALRDALPLVVDPFLRILVAAAQQRAGMWVYNGEEFPLMLTFFVSSFAPVAIASFQAYVLWYGADEMVGWLLSQAGLKVHEVVSAENGETSPHVALEEILRIVISIVLERTHAGDHSTPEMKHAWLRRRTVTLLAVGGLQFSELSELLWPEHESAPAQDVAALEAVLAETAVAKKGKKDFGVYELKRSAWTDFDPFDVTMERAQVEGAMEAYVAAQVPAGKKAGKAAGSPAVTALPLPSLLPLLPPFARLPELVLRSVSVLDIVWNVLRAASLANAKNEEPPKSPTKKKKAATPTAGAGAPSHALVSLALTVLRLGARDVAGYAEVMYDEGRAMEGDSFPTLMSMVLALRGSKTFADQAGNIAALFAVLGERDPTFSARVGERAPDEGPAPAGQSAEDVKRARQAAIMARFAAKQKAFMTKVEAAPAEGTGEEAAPMAAEPTATEDEGRGCVLCRASTTESVCLFTLIKRNRLQTMIRRRATRVGTPDYSAEAPMEVAQERADMSKRADMEEGEDGETVTTPNGPIHCRACETLQSEETGFPKLTRVMVASLCFPPRGCQVIMQACGHGAHDSCFRRHMTALREQGTDRTPLINPSANEFTCPVCSALSNSLLPPRPAPDLAAPAPLDHVIGFDDVSSGMGQLMHDAVNGPTPTASEVAAEQTAAQQASGLGGVGAIATVLGRHTHSLTPAIVAAMLADSVAGVELETRTIEEAPESAGSPLPRVLRVLNRNRHAFLRDLFWGCRMLFTNFDQRAVILALFQAMRMADDPGPEAADMMGQTFLEKDMFRVLVAMLVCWPRTETLLDILPYFVALCHAAQRASVASVADTHPVEVLGAEVVFLRRVVLLRSLVVAPDAAAPAIEGDATLEEERRALLAYCGLSDPSTGALDDSLLATIAQNWAPLEVVVLESASTLPLHPLPRRFVDLSRETLSMLCQNCGQHPMEPGLCLICGTLMCVGEECCMPDSGVQYEAARHTLRCCEAGAVTLLRHAAVVLFREGGSVFQQALYLDAHGEEDLSLRRGQPLFLSEARHAELAALFNAQGVEQFITRGIPTARPWWCF